jgi:DNA-binding CsgD family transcriptional regulator
LRTFREMRPSLVVLDLNLPGIGGTEVIARLKVADPKARILVLSGQRHPLTDLSARDLEIPRLLAAGRNLPEIAEMAGIGYKTAANCCSRLKGSLGAAGTAGLIQHRDPLRSRRPRRRPGDADEQRTSSDGESLGHCASVSKSRSRGRAGPPRPLNGFPTLSRRAALA